MKVGVVSSSQFAMVVEWPRCRKGSIWPAGGRSYSAGGYERLRNGHRTKCRAICSSTAEVLWLLPHGLGLIVVAQRVQ